MSDVTLLGGKLPSVEQLMVIEAAGVPALATLAMDRAIANGDVVPVAKQGVTREQLEAALASGLAAAKRISQEGENAVLTPAQIEALELFVLVVSRPSLFVKKGKPVGVSELWPEIDKVRLAIPSLACGVGRIQAATGSKIGTGFIAATNRVITNNHVVCGLLAKPPSFWKTDPEAYDAGCKHLEEVWKQAPAVFELCGEIDSQESNPARFVRVVSQHPRVDFAVLEIDAMPPGSTTLPLAAKEPTEFVGGRLFVLGFPTLDTQRTPNVVFSRIFGTDPEALGRKRFSPGTAIRWESEATFHHDASTLAGSSGSCVVDFATREVVGIHYAGLYSMERNYAVPLWKYREDPTLTGAGIKF